MRESTPYTNSLIIKDIRQSLRKAKRRGKKNKIRALYENLLLLVTNDQAAIRWLANHYWQSATRDRKNHSRRTRLLTICKRYLKQWREIDFDSPERKSLEMAIAIREEKADSAFEQQIIKHCRTLRAVTEESKIIGYAKCLNTIATAFFHRGLAREDKLIRSGCSDIECASMIMHWACELHPQARYDQNLKKIVKALPGQYLISIPGWKT